MKYIRERLHLHMFDGAAAGADSGAQAGDGGFASLEGSEPTVVYGKQEGSEDTTKTEGSSQVAADNKEGGQDPPVDKTKAFKDLIRGEYKEEYQKLFQTQLNSRMKKYNGMEERLQRSDEVLGMLYGVYGIHEGDLEGLARAIQYDDNLIQTQAEAQGLTPEQYRYNLQLQQQAAYARQQAEAAQQEAFMRQQYAQWEAEAEQMKNFFPDFDLAAECDNPDFTGLLQSGVSVQAAFNAVHANEIMQGAIAQTAQSVKQSVADNIRARGNRPAENGTVTRPGVIVKNDPSKFTAKDREEIARRVARGETIKF